MEEPLFLEGSIKLSSLLPEAEIDQRDEDVMAFVLISSETNDLPLGSAKDHWSIEALERLQPDIDKATEWAKKGRFFSMSVTNTALQYLKQPLADMTCKGQSSAADSTGRCNTLS